MKYESRFGFPTGPWYRWFAWHPVGTSDRGTRWLRFVWRRRFQSHDYLDGPTMRWFLNVVDKPDDA